MGGKAQRTKFNPETYFKQQLMKNLGVSATDASAIWRYTAAAFPLTSNTKPVPYEYRFQVMSLDILCQKAGIHDLRKATRRQLEWVFKSSVRKVVPQKQLTLITPEMRTFYGTVGGKELERYFATLIKSNWKHKTERNLYTTIYLRAMGLKGNPTQSELLAYSKKQEVVTDYILAMAKRNAYNALSGKSPAGRTMLRIAGVTGKMQGGKLKVAFTDSPDLKSLRMYIRTYVITPAWKGS